VNVSNDPNPNPPEHAHAMLTVDSDELDPCLLPGTVLVVPYQGGHQGAALVRAGDELLVLWVCDMPDGKGGTATMLTNEEPRWPVIFRTRQEAVEVAATCLRGWQEVGHDSADR
jgi:hypothetical protein